MRWRFWRKKGAASGGAAIRESNRTRGSITEARSIARKVIDSRDAAGLDKLFDSADPIQALSASLEYNFAKRCCIPGRLFTLGKIQEGGGGHFRCTHCEHFAGPYWEQYWSQWFDNPSSSPAGARRRPHPEMAAEAIERMEAGLNVLKRDDPEEMTNLLAKGDPVSLRIFVANFGFISEALPKEKVLDQIIESSEAWDERYEAEAIKEIGETIMVNLGMIEGTYAGIRLGEEIERRRNSIRRTE